MHTVDPQSAFDADSNEISKRDAPPSCFGAENRMQFVIKSERNRLRHNRSPFLSSNDRAEIEFRSAATRDARLLSTALSCLDLQFRIGYAFAANLQGNRFKLRRH